MGRAELTVDGMIVGAQKAGSTSLLRYLQSHPRVLAHPHMEMAYFTDPGEFELGCEAAFRRYFGHGRWSPGTRIMAKNVILMARRTGLERLREHNPACRIVVLLRDPVERLRSSYRWEVSQGREEAPFQEVVRELLDARSRHLENRRYWKYMYQSEYPDRLRDVLDYFPRDQVAVYLTEELASTPDRVVAEILRSLELDPGEGFDASGRHNETRRLRRPLAMRVLTLLSGPRTGALGRLKEALPESLVVRSREALDALAKGERSPTRTAGPERESLMTHFQPQIDELEEMLGRELSAWRRARVDT